jgi:multidrug resistance efflux pump
MAQHIHMRNFLFVSALLFLAGCGGEDKPKANANTTVDPKAVQVREVVGIGKVEPESEITNLAAPVGGVITGVFRNDGDSTRNGEVLLQLDDAIEQARAGRNRAQISTQQSQVALERTRIKDIQVRLDNKRRQLQESQSLLSKGAETRDAVADLETEVGSLEGQLEERQASVRAAEQRIGELQQDLKLANTEIEQKKIRSPQNGTILDMQVSKGESISQYATYAEFAPAGRIIVRAEVDELYSNKIQPGQQVDVRYTGTAQTLARGEVISAGAYLKKKSLFSVKADDQEDRRVREVRIALPDSARLTINTKVECIFKIQP